MYNQPYQPRGTTRRRKLRAQMRLKTWQERVCLDCKQLLGSRFECPLCGEPTVLRTIDATGPFTGALRPEPAEASSL